MATEYVFDEEQKHFIKMRSDPRPLKEQQLVAMAGQIEANLREIDGIRGLTVAQASAVHQCLEKFRKPLQEGILTWDEAVGKIALPWQEELVALTGALEKSKLPK